MRLTASRLPLHSQAAAALISGMPMIPPSATSRMASVEMAANGMITMLKTCPIHGMESTRPPSALRPAKMPIAPATMSGTQSSDGQFFQEKRRASPSDMPSSRAMRRAVMRQIPSEMNAHTARNQMPPNRTCQKL